MKKIVIIGSPGAGKSTLARELGDILDIEVFHLDNFFWQKGWKKYPRQERIEIEQRILIRHQWIIEGCYLSTSERRLVEADTIILLDMHPFLCLWRVTNRYFMFRGHVRHDLPPGSSERLSLAFFNKILFFPYQERKQLLAKIAMIQTQQVCQKKIVMLCTRKDVEDFLRQQADEWQREYRSASYQLVH